MNTLLSSIIQIQALAYYSTHDEVPLCSLNSLHTTYQSSLTLVCRRSQLVTFSAQGECLSKISLTLASRHSGSVTPLADHYPVLNSFQEPTIKYDQILSVGITPSLITTEGPYTSVKYAASFLTLEDHHSTFLVLETSCNQIEIMSVSKVISSFPISSRNYNNFSEVRGSVWNHH